MDTNKRNILVFDVCDTLFYSNTTFDFIAYVLKSTSRTKYLALKALISRTSPVAWPLMVLAKLSKVDWQKKLALQLLKGITKEELYAYGRSFCQEYLNTCKIQQTHALLSQTHAEGTLLLLLSASLDPVIAAVADSVGATFKSTELQYDKNGVFTGEIKKEMTGQKLNELKNILKDSDYHLTVATDNFTDRHLVEAAHKRYVVIYNEKARAYWQDLSPEFIQLYPS